MKRTLFLTAALASLAGLLSPAAALASGDDRIAVEQPAAWMPLGELIAKLEGQGYSVLEAEREDGRYWQVRMQDANGMIVETYLDPATGMPANRIEREDD
ncbi:hypothetical protein Ga0609869_001699 [Rhodovulum iodosum]|uniref:PepSY domain-containing protein n=1 Tax=Rhodovulum iodosum TaxID=68291 RepID=A0ABV3XSN4_9RHOB|nr:PepSY domain-containing protein [Rhodovulum robiginosum]RSK30662.1 PepSY domain-containing protein [Rhodovulum robiginosum]